MVCGVDMLRMISSVVKNSCFLLAVLFLLSGCITIRSLNVNTYNSKPETPIPIYDAGHVGATSESGQKMAPISDMANLDVMPPPSLTSTNNTYAIHAGDKLDIKFFYNKELNESVTVRPDGRISLQLIHDVQAASLSPDEFSAVLEEKYGEHIVDPEISVIVRSFDTRKVFVDGQVGKPGMIEMSQYMTVMQAIASAGGLRDTALKDDVVLIRRNYLNKPFVITVDVDAIQDGTDVSQDIALQPYDILFVPKSTVANLNTWVDQYIRRMIPIYLNYDVYNLSR
jgi:protein involved in polysaccharide export with SLBB domain